MRAAVSCIYLPRYLDHIKWIPVNVIRLLSSLVLKEDNSAFEKCGCSYMISQHKMRFTYSSSARYIQPPVYQDTYAISQKQYHQWHSYGLIVQVLSLGLRRNYDISYVGYGQHNSKEASLQELKTKEWHISHRY